jgi:hypothetical protein
MAKLIAYLLLGQLSGFESRSQKYKMGDISEGVANTLQPAKKYTKKTFRNSCIKIVFLCNLSL